MTEIKAIKYYYYDDKTIRFVAFKREFRGKHGIWTGFVDKTANKAFTIKIPDNLRIPAIIEAEIKDMKILADGTALNIGEYRKTIDVDKFIESVPKVKTYAGIVVREIPEHIYRTTKHFAVVPQSFVVQTTADKMMCKAPSIADNIRLGMCAEVLVDAYVEKERKSLRGLIIRPLPFDEAMERIKQEFVIMDPKKINRDRLSVFLQGLTKKIPVIGGEQE